MKRRLLVASDLDGTLLDVATGRWEPARPALAALRECGAWLVPCSSKTRAEVEPLVHEWGGEAPFIVENGAAVVLRDAAPLVLGTPRATLVPALAAIATECGAAITGFASLGVAQLARITGLTIEAAARAMDRHYDEPFLLPQPDSLAAVAEAASRRGLRVTHGGRFHHLTGPHDKGSALRELLSLLDERGEVVKTLGLGDAANDIPMLRVVARRILMPRPDGNVDPALAEAFPETSVAPAPGAEGWNAAVLAFLAGTPQQS